MIDTHVHFWDPAKLNYPWLERAKPFQRSFLPRHYRTAAPRVKRAVFVEANVDPRQATQELAFVQGLRKTAPWIAGIVAYVDLLHDSAQTRIEQLANIREVVGIRQNIQGHSRGFCTQPAFITGVRQAGDHKLTFDVCVTANQLDDVSELVEQCPGTRFVLDHCGKPAIARDAFKPWSRSIERLAQQPNIACKISGLLTEARDNQRTPETIGPYIDRVRACFGDDRLMFGSDWPVLTTSGGLSTWLDIVGACTSAWPQKARAGLYTHNAARIYRLKAANG